MKPNQTKPNYSKSTNDDGHHSFSYIHSYRFKRTLESPYVTHMKWLSIFPHRLTVRTVSTSVHFMSVLDFTNRRGVMAKVLDYCFEVSVFEFLSRYNVYF